MLKPNKVLLENFSSPPPIRALFQRNYPLFLRRLCRLLFGYLDQMSKDLKVVKSINFRALQIYKEIFGDLRILPGYVLQTSSFKRVPAYFDCYKLGKHVSALREWYKTDKSVFEPEDLKRIDEMGFVWQLQDPKADLALLAFKVYSRLNRNCEVPLEYVVPKSDDWPQITWGLRLGEILHGIRSEGSYKSIHEGLRELGVNFNRKSSNKSRFDRIYDGLSAYKAVNGDLRVPRKFVVPQDSKEYPKHTWGIQLGKYAKGATVNKLRLCRL